MKRPTQVLGRLAAAATMVYAFLVVLGMSPALAQAPRPWAVGMQAGFSPVKRDINSLNHMVLIIIALITLAVASLLVWVMWRYNAKRNPVPSALSHNTVLEVAWTIIPILILVVMAIPSFRLVYYEDRTDNPDLTVKVTGHQWYWEYTYPELKNLNFSSYIIPDDKLKPGQPRLLAVDNELVLPVGQNVRLLETSGDVIHSFFVPSLGVQRYAIPGRTIETWVRIDKPGVYYGECNQICGTNHSRMPIVVRGVSPQEFQAWTAQAQKQFADAAPVTAPAVRAAGVRLASATDAQR
jgi:cytochrome c oxidase subunit II